MRRSLIVSLVCGIAGAAYARVDPDAGTFVLHDNGGPNAKKKDVGGKASKLEATKTDAVLKFFVLDKDKGPIKGVVVALTSPAGAKFYTDETDEDGYAETLVPNGQKYELTYLILGRRDVAATVTVTDEPKQTVKLTLRYKRPPAPPPFVLDGIVFDTGKAYVRRESEVKLDIVAEFMLHKRSARVEISGHTDTKGNAKSNKALSQKRAEACRKYLVGKGVAADRITAVGYGGERPIASNDTEEGRQQNRRIEAKELPPPDAP
ncbi:MAG TPA: OmpA family protein [Polyangia bacterium]|jgi:outer membrane protein OmpA-like peptidoglycan-associated protein|nr:OmpA family protein [Polyangia bacterium]